MLEDSVLFEKNEALIKSWEAKQQSAAAKHKTKKTKSSPGRSVGSRRSKPTKPLRSPGVEIRPRQVEKMGANVDDDDDDEKYFADEFKETKPTVSSSIGTITAPRNTAKRPSTAPSVSSIRPSYVVSADGIITEAEAKARLKEERSKLLAKQKKKKRAELAKQREDALSAKERIYRNKEVSFNCRLKWL